jgi:hypothetical protein
MSISVRKHPLYLLVGIGHFEGSVRRLRPNLWFDRYQLAGFYDPPGAPAVEGVLRGFT